MTTDDRAQLLDRLHTIAPDATKKAIAAALEALEVGRYTEIAYCCNLPIQSVAAISGTHDVIGGMHKLLTSLKVPRDAAKAAEAKANDKVEKPSE